MKIIKGLFINGGVMLLLLIPAYCTAAERVFLADTNQTGGLFDPNEKPQIISKHFSFTEGASVDKKGNVFFTDQPNNKIWEYTTDKQLFIFMSNTGRSNGTYFDNKGNLISCADEHGQLWSISPRKKVKVLINNFGGHQLNGPNDVWIAPDGGMYITDPYYQRDYWERKKSDLDGQKVYYLPKDSSNLRIVVSDMKAPNGIVGTPDGKYLYISDLEAGKTFKYTITSDGVLANKQLIIEQGSDGMTLDNQGNIYLTGNGVTVYNPAGVKIAHIAINEPWTANLCFGGKNRDILFITASKAIYILPMKVRGVE